MVHAQHLGLGDLSELDVVAFNAEVRNSLAVTHADIALAVFAVQVFHELVVGFDALEVGVQLVRFGALLRDPAHRVGVLGQRGFGIVHDACRDGLDGCLVLHFVLLE